MKENALNYQQCSKFCIMFGVELFDNDNSFTGAVEGTAVLKLEDYNSFQLLSFS